VNSKNVGSKDIRQITTDSISPHPEAKIKEGNLKKGKDGKRKSSCKKRKFLEKKW